MSCNAIRTRSPYRYDGIHWDPPAAERHVWRHERPPRPPALRVYEAHVGMSSEEPKVASYTEFKDTVRVYQRRVCVSVIVRAAGRGA